MNPFPSETRRLEFVARVLAVATLVCVAFSWRLWISTRLYPLAPLFGLVPPFPYPLDLAVAAVLVGLLVALAVRPLSVPLAAGVVGLFAVLFVQDQSRLWPSFYEFFFLFLMLVARRPGGGEPEAVRTLAGMRCVVAAVYFWGGFQKLTPHFFREEFPWFVRPLTDLVPFEVPFLPVLGMAAAVAEMLIGIGLLTTRFRRLALAEALVMHAVILVCIGPIRSNWNDSAWIWSLASAVLAVALFRGAPPFDVRQLVAAPPLRCLPQALAVVFVGLMPVLNNVNRWDSALSFNVYTGNVSSGFILMAPEAAARLPAEITRHVARQGEWAVLDVGAWSMAEFNAGAYPEDRVFRTIFAAVCGRLGDPATRLLVIRKADWFWPKQPTVRACGAP
jgi:hypothetical protein